MRIAWCSIDALAGAFAIFDPHIVVSISSPNWPMPAIAHRPVLALKMHDIEKPMLDKVAPSHRHALAFFDLVDRKPDRLLIQCQAGLSRSPALVIAAAVKAGRDPAEVCVIVKKAVPHAQPNRLILDIASDLIGLDMVTPALRTFAYTRGAGLPVGERAGLCELVATETAS